jgi:hypothetical protein
MKIEAQLSKSRIATLLTERFCLIYILKVIYLIFYDIVICPSFQN